MEAGPTKAGVATLLRNVLLVDDDDCCVKPVEDMMTLSEKSVPAC